MDLESRVIGALEEQIAGLQRENAALEAAQDKGDGVEQKAKIAMMEVKDEIVESLITDYGYKILSSERMFGGLSSSNFRLTLEDAGGGQCELMLKLANKDHDVTDIEHQVRVLKVLAKHKYKTNLMHARADDDKTFIVHSSEGHIALLLDYFEVIAGDKLIAQVSSTPTKVETLLGGLGVALAQLHQIDFAAAEEGGCAPLRDLRCGFPVSNTGDLLKPGFAEEQLQSDLIAGNQFVPFLLERMARFRALYDEQATDLPTGFIHGDAFLDNALFDESTCEFKALVDWEDSCIGPYALDLAVCIAACSFTSTNELIEERVRYLIRGYTKQRPLAVREMAMVPDFMWAATMSCAYWRFVQFNVVAPEEQAKNTYKIMHQRVERIEALDLAAVLKRCV
jgi:Ser/Thr protein kinase RdoA (MazF antagonist)